MPKFTFEKEKDLCLPLHDINVERTDIGFKASVNRKSTFTRQYLRRESFSPQKRRISTLVLRVLMTCTKRNGEIERIKNILYWSTTVLKTSKLRLSKNLLSFPSLKAIWPRRVPYVFKSPLNR